MGRGSLSLVLCASGLLTGLSAVARSETSASQTGIPQGCKVLDDCRVVREVRPWPRRDRSKEFSMDRKGVYYFGTKYDFDPKSFRVFKTKNCSNHTQTYLVDAKDVYFAQAQSCGQSCDSPDYHGYYWDSIGAKEPDSFKILSGGYAISGNQVLYIWNSGMQSEADAATFQTLMCVNGSGVVGMDRLRFYIDGKAATRKDVQALIQSLASEKPTRRQAAGEPTKRGG